MRADANTGKKCGKVQRQPPTQRRIRAANEATRSGDRYPRKIHRDPMARCTTQATPIDFEEPDDRVLRNPQKQPLCTRDYNIRQYTSYKVVMWTLHGSPAL